MRQTTLTVIKVKSLGLCLFLGWASTLISDLVVDQVAQMTVDEMSNKYFVMVTNTNTCRIRLEHFCPNFLRLIC